MKRKLLFAIVALMCSVGSWAYQTPVANGIYYLYNTGCTSGESGFMSTGNSYGFQVVIDDFGFPIKLIDAGNGNFQFQFIHHEGYLSDDGFMYSDGGNTGDNPRARTITLQDQGNGIYKLINTSNNKEIEQWYSHNVVGDGEGNRRNYLWQFLSKAERDAMVAGYTTSVKLAAATSMGMPADVDTEAEFDSYLSANYIGIDQSSKIQNGTFDISHTTTGWTTAANENRNFNIGWGNTDPKTTPEVYEGAGSISQTVTVDKVGLYKVSVNATYRCGNNDNNNRIGDLGYDGSVAYLKANDNFTKIGDWYSGKINGNGPGSPSEANSAYFANGKYLTEVFVYVGDAKTIEISLHSHAMTWGGWFMFNNFKLTYYSNEVSEEDATAILTTATSLEEQEMDASIKSNLTSAKNTFNGSHTIANYNALQTAITAAQASADAYALFAPERTKALALGLNDEDIAALAPDVHALMVAEYNFVNSNYSYGVELGTWTTTGETATNKGQHWDGTGTSTYLEQLNRQGANPAGWEANSWEVGYSQNVNLPAGNYVFKVAGRRSSEDVTLSLVVKQGNDVIGTVNDFPLGDTGKGIDKSGATNFGDGDYANNGIGRGWQWRYVKFTLNNPATVNVAVSAVAVSSHQWMSFCNATVQTDDEDNVELMESLVNLNSAITSATLTKNTTNVGTGVFQLNETTNNTLWSAYETAKSNAEGYTLTSSSTVAEVDALTAALNAAMDNYKFQTPNAPEEGKHYYIKVATSGHEKENNAVVIGRQPYPVMSGNYISDQTGFTFKASAAPAPYLAQAVTFTQVEGNTYNIAFEREEGTVYMTYGSLNNSKVNWKDSQIQGTTESTQKGTFKIVATTTANVFNIYNTNTNSTIACQTNGSLYTEAGNADFTIAEASQAEVTVSCKAGKFGTTIVPFTPSINNSDIKFYTVTGVENERVQITEVTELAANVPYLIKNEGSSDFSETLSGWGTATADKVDGTLTGVYTAQIIAASVDATAEDDGELRYVLQTQNDGQAFYKVDADFTATPYKCFLTVAAPKTGSTVKAFFLDFGGEDAINGIEAETENAEIFNLAGQRVNKAQRGIYIINGKKVLVK